MKKITGILLLFSVILSLAACSSGTEKNIGAVTTDLQAGELTGDTGATNETLGALDYGGRTVNILTQNINSVEHNWVINEICVEDLTSDPVNDAVYYRNAAVEELLGIKINQVVKNDDNQLVNAVNSGDPAYDIVTVPADVGAGVIYNGSVHDLYSGGVETYLNTDSPWWSRYWIEEAEIDGRLYAITGAPSLSLFRYAMVIYYNKRFGKSLNLEDPYDVVADGRWTIDYCNEIISGLYLDVDGDRTVNGLDRFGIAFNTDESCDMFWSAFDMDLVRNGEDGWFEINLDEKDKFTTAFNKVFSLVNESPDSFVNTGGTGVLNDIRDMFSLNKLFLAPLHLKFGESQAFKYMNVDYCVLPHPKYDEAQTEYYTYVQDQYSIFMVPTSASDPVMSGAILEAMAIKSAETVRPAYFDSVLRGKYTRDGNTRQMIDMIMANVKVDASFIYGSILLNQPEEMFSNLINDGDKNFEKKYNTQTRVAAVLLKEFKTKFEAAIAGQ